MDEFEKLARIGLAFLPPVQPSESIYGYVCRCSILNGVGMGTILPLLIGRSAVKPPWTVPANLHQLARFFKPVFGSAEQILTSHTCVPAHLPFVAQDRRGLLMRTIMEGEPGRGLPTIIGEVGSSGRTQGRRAFCLKCVRADLLRCGFAYWHREHSFSMLTHCPQHGTGLVQGCGNCRFSHQTSNFALLPSLKCWCGAELRTVEALGSNSDGRVSSKLAKIAQELLSGDFMQRTPKEIGRYFVYQLHKRGFGRGRSVDKEAFRAALTETYPRDLLEALSAQPSKSSWAWRLCWEHVPSSKLGPNLLLFHFLGGVPSDSQVLEANRWVSTRYLRTSHPSSELLEDFESRRQWRRKFVLDFLKRHPNATRNDLHKAAPHVGEFLRHYDADWFERVAPGTRRGKRSRGEPEARGAVSAMDSRASSHVLKKCREVLASATVHPKRLSKQMLLAGFPGAYEFNYRALEDHFPLTKQAIAKSLEDYEAYWDRVARNILEQYEPHDFEGALKEIQRRRAKFSRCRAQALSQSLWKKRAS